ncbi:hypothetical protein AGMMS49525_03470 [Bacteroidia bacterium]|nr:hypothetical protein AGMMS49525_03470 [Bacteroidia bacterium]
MLATALLSGISVNAQNEFSIQAGGGLSAPNYELSQDKKATNGFGGEIGLGYTCFFNSQWGFGTGIGLGFYNSEADLSGFSLEISDFKNEFGASKWRTTLNKYVEKQSVMFANIPLMLQFQGDGAGTNFFLRAGAKIGIPVSATYTVDNASMTNAAFMPPPFDYWIEAPKFAGLGTFDNYSVNEKLSLNLAFSLALETGLKWRLSDNSALYTGVYVNYGLNDIRKEADRPFLKQNVADPEHFSTNSVLASQGLTDKASLLAAGVTFRLAFGKSSSASGAAFSTQELNRLFAMSERERKEKFAKVVAAMGVSVSTSELEREFMAGERESKRKFAEIAAARGIAFSPSELDQIFLLPERDRKAKFAEIAHRRGASITAAELEQQFVASERERNAKFASIAARHGVSISASELARILALDDRDRNANFAKMAATNGVTITAPELEQHYALVERERNARFAEIAAKHGIVFSASELQQLFAMNEHERKAKFAEVVAKQGKKTISASELEKQFALVEHERDAEFAEIVAKYGITLSAPELARLFAADDRERKVTFTKLATTRGVNIIEPELERQFAEVKRRSKTKFAEVAARHGAFFSTPDLEELFAGSVRDRNAKFTEVAAKQGVAFSVNELEELFAVLERERETKFAAFAAARGIDVTTPELDRIFMMTERRREARLAQDAAAEIAAIEAAANAREANRAIIAQLQSSEILYEVGKVFPPADAQRMLDRKASLMKVYPSFDLLLEGHSCDIGTHEVNYRIGLERAVVVKNYLVDKGIAPERIRVVSKAETEPRVPNSSARNRDLNRRLVFIVIDAGK